MVNTGLERFQPREPGFRILIRSNRGGTEKRIIIDHKLRFIQNIIQSCHVDIPSQSVTKWTSTATTKSTR